MRPHTLFVPRASLAVSLLALLVATLLPARDAAAQPLGSFTWQLQPFCNRLTVNVTQNGGVYTLDGFDDQCGAPQRAPLVGLAVPNPDGTIGLGFHIATVPGGRTVSVESRIALATIGGPWTDSAGNSGTLVFNGQAAGGARPAPSAGLAPGSVTSAALATGAVTSAAVADGSLGAADVNSAEIQRRISGTCPAGLYMTTAAAGGAPICSAGGAVVALGTSAGAANAGIRNTAIGFQALQTNVNGWDNTAVGSTVLRSFAPVPGGQGGNTGVGSGALFAATTGFWNTAMGDGALGALTTGATNTAVGRLALRNNVTGGGNTAVGNDAGYNTTGAGNIAIGNGAAQNVTTGSLNIHIGNTGSASDSSVIRIGTTGQQTAAFIAGIRGVTTATAAIPVLVGTDGQLGTTSSSRRFKFDIADMDDFSARIARLRPVTFRYTQPMADGSTPLDFGLIAEEVADVFPELAVRGSDGRIETVAYHKLPALLLNELQKQQRTILDQARAIESLQQAIETLRTDLVQRQR